MNPGLLKRSYAILDGKRHPGQLSVHSYRNDGRKGGFQFPRTSATGKPIHYTTVYMRPGKHGANRRLSNARLTVGSDGSAWVSIHYGQRGEPVRRIQ